MTDYEKQARDFLRKAHARMSISFLETVEGFPFSNDHYMHDKYIVRIDRAGKSYRFPFYASAYDTQRNERPTAYDVLSCVEKWDVGRFVDFVDEYGYELRSREEFLRVERIWKECGKQYKKLLRLFGPYLMDDLRQIQ